MILNMECDVVFLSYKEPGAERNYSRLLESWPLAKRVHGVKGIHNAFREAANLATTSFFFTIDGDNEVLPSFRFQLPDLPNITKESVCIWQSENPVNGLLYGYGGIKCFGRDAAFRISDEWLDVINPSFQKLLFVKSVASITRFNTSPFDAWKAGFRECVMLTSSGCSEMHKGRSSERLNAWKTSRSTVAFGDWAVRGAYDGEAYSHKGCDSALINNYDWLQEEFERRYADGF